MTRRTILRFEWHNEHATAPDGTSYAVFSEHVRHERRIYWPAMHTPERNLSGLHTGGWTTVGDDVYYSRQAAMRRAERHWHYAQLARNHARAT